MAYSSRIYWHLLGGVCLWFANSFHDTPSTAPVTVTLVLQQSTNRTLTARHCYTRRSRHYFNTLSGKRVTAGRRRFNRQEIAVILSVLIYRYLKVSCSSVIPGLTIITAVLQLKLSNFITIMHISEMEKDSNCFSVFSSTSVTRFIFGSVCWAKLASISSMHNYRYLSNSQWKFSCCCLLEKCLMETVAFFCLFVCILTFNVCKYVWIEEFLFCADKNLSGLKQIQVWMDR